MSLDLDKPDLTLKLRDKSASSDKLQSSEVNFGNNILSFVQKYKELNITSLTEAKEKYGNSNFFRFSSDQAALKDKFLEAKSYNLKRK